jgi:tetratricopeptide (TPR) repeat protein
LFAGEDTDRELPLPAEELPARITSTTQAVQGTNGSVTSASQGSLSPLAINIAQDPTTTVDEQNYATESAVHRLAAIASQQRKKRMIQAGAATGVALGAGLLFLLTHTPPKAPMPIGSAVTAPAVVVAAPPPKAEAKPSPAAPEPTPAAETPEPAGDKDKEKPRASAPARPTTTATPPRAHEAAKGKRTAVITSNNARIKRTLAAGLEALEKGEYIHAAEQLEEVSNASPTSPDVLAALAEAEFELARYSRAVTHAKKAATLAPRNVRYQSLLGDSYFKLNRMREAAQAYAAAAALAPQDPSIRDRKARAEAAMSGDRSSGPPEQ